MKNRIPSTLYLILIIATLNSCKYEKQKTILNSLTTEVHYLQRDVSAADNERAKIEAQERALNSKADSSNDDKNVQLKIEIQTATSKLNTLKTEYEKVLLRNAEFKKENPIEE